LHYFSVYYTERLFQFKSTAVENFRHTVCETAKENIKTVIENAEKHLVYLYARISSLVDEEIRRLKNEHDKAAKRVKELESAQNGLLQLIEPKNIIQARLNLLKYQHILLSNRYAELTDYYLPLTISDHYFPAYIDYGTLLSRRELRYIQGIYELYMHREIGMTRGYVSAPSAKLEKSQQLILQTLNEHLLKENPKAVPFKNVKSNLSSMDLNSLRAIVVHERRVGILTKEFGSFVFRTPFYSSEELTDIKQLDTPTVMLVLVQNLL